MVDEAAAKPRTDVMLGVHTLSEFSYCGRAGIISYESKPTDFGTDTGRPENLGYLPNYNLATIEARLVQFLIVFYASAALLALSLMGLVVSSTAKSQGICLLVVVLALAISAYLFAPICTLRRRRREAKGAPPRIPSFDIDSMVPIYWWELCAADYAPKQFEDPFRVSRELKLNGHPWAVLFRGTERIPVLKLNGKSNVVHENHRVRIAGYCHLLEATTGCSSPFGVVLFPNGRAGVAIQYSEEQKHLLMRSYRRAQSVIAGRITQPPSEPSNPNICIECPFGRLRKYLFEQTDVTLDGNPLPPNSVRVGENLRLHTVCGDRFRWNPPALAAEKASKS